MKNFIQFIKENKIRKITTKKTEDGIITIIKEKNIESQIFQFNSNQWWAEYYINGKFNSGLRGKFKTKKECVDHFDTVVSIVKRWEDEK